MTRAPNYIFASGCMEALPCVDNSRRFFVLDPLAANNARQHADAWRSAQAEQEYRQRESGVRVRQCSTGSHALFDRRGRFIGRMVPVTPDTLDPPPAAMARRMAYSEELHGACRMVDHDYEAMGGVSPVTVALLRKLLATIGGA